jgi:hypothetical protein
MKKEPPSSTTGRLAGLLLLMSVLVGGIGLAFDFLAASGARFWLMAEPGYRALLGAGTAVAAILAGHLLRLLLGRRLDGRRTQRR